MRRGVAFAHEAIRNWADMILGERRDDQRGERRTASNPGSSVSWTDRIVDSSKLRYDDGSNYVITEDLLPKMSGPTFPSSEQNQASVVIDSRPDSTESLITNSLAATSGGFHFPRLRYAILGNLVCFAESYTPVGSVRLEEDMNEVLQERRHGDRHPTIGFDYLQWKIGTIIGRQRTVNSAFGTQLRTPTFADLRATRGFVPRAAEVELIRTLSSNYPLFMVIGANFGVWVTALAAAHPTAHVYCFEPTPNTFSGLSDNIALNGLRNVTALQLAVSDSAGIFRFRSRKMPRT